MKKNKITLLNIISNLILQLCNIISAFIIPRLILKYFGSNVNGLVSSLTQFLSYISLIEGGVTSVITAALYKPLIEKDNDKISSIVKTTDIFFKKIGFIYVFYSIFLAFFYPFVFKTEFSYIFVMSLTIILSINLFIQYMFSITLKTLLNADKKIYVVSFTQIFMIVLNILFAYISVKIYPSIHIFKLISGLLYILQPIIFSNYVDKHYSLNKCAKKDLSLIKNRWDGFAINLAAFIHNCTDIVILTIFVDLTTVSIYSVYALVTTGLRTIVNAISNAIVPTIGQSYAKNDLDDLNLKMDIYEFIIIFIVFLLFTIAGLMITPFVMVYTSNVNDANYYQPLFGVLFVISEALYLIKFPHLNLAYSANKFKELTKPAYMEAFINIFVSLILVKKFSLIGVAIGTICSMFYRMIIQIMYTRKLIYSRNIWKFFYKIFVFSIPTLLSIIIIDYFHLVVKFELVSWFTYSLGYALFLGTLYLLFSLLFFKKELKFIKNYLMH